MKWLASLAIITITIPPLFAAELLTSNLDELEKRNVAGTANRGERIDLARQYVSSGRYYEAMKIADALLAVDPEDSEVASIRTEAVAGLKAHQESRLRDAEVLASKQNATDEDRLALAHAYFEGGRYLSAADTYRALPENLRTRDVRLREARALAWGGKLDEAEKMYHQLRADGIDHDLELEYGRVLSWMGASKAAVKQLKSVYEKDGHEGCAVALANALAWSGNRDDAVALLNAHVSNNPDSLEAKNLLDDISNSTHLTLERVDRMIGAEPYNLSLRVRRAELLVDAGRYGEALREVEFVDDHSTEEVEGLANLRARATELRKVELTNVEEKKRALDLSRPSSPEEILSVAKAYVGLEEYDEAIALYERYLELRPDDLDARIQYARILGWDRRYNAATREYRELVEDNPERADLQLEYAQILSYNNDYIPAVRSFRRLTQLSGNPRAHLYEDVPARAHFNLGQIYRWYGWHDHAIAEQNNAIQIDGAYSPARRELDLVRHLRPTGFLEGTYTEAENSNGFHLTRLDFEGRKWTSRRTAIDVIAGRHTFERGGDQIDANMFGAGGLYRYDDRTTARARLGLNFYEQGVGTRPFWSLGAEWLPNLQSRAALDYAHYDIVYDVFSVESLRDDPLHIDDLRAHYDYSTGGIVSWLADASYGMISDDNERFAAHGLVSFRILKDPFVAIKADGRYLAHDFRATRYWSPTDYYSLAGVLQVGQNIRDRVFWTVEAKYGRAFEGDFESDIRAYEAKVTVPVSDMFDVIGAYADGKSGRIEAPFGAEEFVDYWQRRWYVGLRVKRLFADDDNRPQRNPYYFDERRLEESPVIPPAGERP